MRSKKAVWFGLCLLAGIALGVIYGWLVNPAQLVDAPPDTLRKDYKADYALMVGEIYARENDAERAARRLALLGDEPPVSLVQRAILDGQALGYAASDLQTLGKLLQAMQVWQEAEE